MRKIFFFFSLLTIVKSNIIGYCDLKGNVNKPGVYEIREKETINDIINKAGGLKKNSYTDNINLSKLVVDEMVIYIHSKGEIEKVKKLNNCKCEPIIKYTECDDLLEENYTTTTAKPIVTTGTTSTCKIAETTTKTTTTKILNEKININTATLEELIKLNGLGESKANKIIEYRNNNGLFEKIEDLLKVDGIGNKTFENIKNYIEV